MKKQIIIEDIKDIQIDGYCIKKNNNCIHDIVIIYKNDIIAQRKEKGSIS